MVWRTRGVVRGSVVCGSPFLLSVAARGRGFRLCWSVGVDDVGVGSGDEFLGFRGMRRDR